MKIKTSELTRRALDWAVAKSEDRLDNYVRDEAMPGTSIVDVEVYQGRLLVYPGGRRPYTEYAPSTDWSQGGPIIERENLELHRTHDEWGAQRCDFPRAAYGPTPLIAAMRCFVASKLGDEVDVPDELINNPRSNQ